MFNHDRIREILTNDFRDDLTVEVIFFGDSPDTGSVTLNKEASAAAPEVKAKL